MKIIIEGTAKEIADLAEMQSRPEKVEALDMHVRRVYCDNGPGFVIVPIKSGVDHGGSEGSVDVERFSKNVATQNVNGTFHVTRNGINVEGMDYVFDDMWQVYGQDVSVKNGKVFTKDGESAGTLRRE